MTKQRQRGTLNGSVTATLHIQWIRISNTGKVRPYIGISFYIHEFVTTILLLVDEVDTGTREEDWLQGWLVEDEENEEKVGTIAKIRLV